METLNRNFNPGDTVFLDIHEGRYGKIISIEETFSGLITVKIKWAGFSHYEYVAINHNKLSKV